VKRIVASVCANSNFIPSSVFSEVH